jgi:integrase
MPINDIRRSDIVRLLDAVEDERGPVAAEKVLAFLRRVFNWHALRSDDFRSPIVRGMSRVRASERARARILTDDELRTVWRTAAGQGAFGRLVRFLLLTGARRTEAAGMPWAELDGADWTLPGARNKTKLDLVRPLPKAALDVLGAKPNGATFAFSTDGGATALCGFSNFKAEFDKAVVAQLRERNSDTQPLPNWTLHDLRRTARSLMSRASVPTDHAERVLGHVIGGVRGTYDRYEYLDEKRDALETLARQIDWIVHRRLISVTLQRGGPRE